MLLSPPNKCARASSPGSRMGSWWRAPWRRREMAHYEDKYRLCEMRCPARIIAALAEETFLKRSPPTGFAILGAPSTRSHGWNLSAFSPTCAAVLLGH